MGWYASVSVDGVSYRVLGDAGETGVLTANQTGVNFTPTRTSFTFTAGAMSINATFLTPVTVSNISTQVFMHRIS